MYLKIKLAGENGSWRLFEIDEVEWNTTWGTLTDETLDKMDTIESLKFRPYVDKRCGVHFISMLIRKRGADTDVQLYCNTQAYVLNDNGETLETLVRKFPKEHKQLNTN